MGALFGGWQGAPLDRIKLFGTTANAKATLEKTVAALKADKAKTGPFRKTAGQSARTCETRSGNAARAQVSKWHVTDITCDVLHVRNQGQSGRRDCAVLMYAQSTGNQRLRSAKQTSVASRNHRGERLITNAPALSFLRHTGTMEDPSPSNAPKYPSNDWGMLAKNPWVEIGATGEAWIAAVRSAWLNSGGTEESFERAFPAFATQNRNSSP